MALKPVKTIAKLGGITLLVYAIASLSFYFFHTRLIFRPDKLSREYVFRFNQPFEEFFIPTRDDVQLNALLFRTSTKPKGIILYFHGNKDNLQRWGEYAADFTGKGYDVLMVDYRGYGKSEGKPDEQDYYRDAKAIWDWMNQQFDHASHIVYGRSLGSAVASHLAGSVTPDLLILETPFDELWGVVYPIFRPTIYFLKPKFRFSNHEHLQQVNCPKLLIHGTNDWVVPLSSALRLKELLHPKDEFVLIDGGSHNNLRKFEAYHAALSRYLK